MRILDIISEQKITTNWFMKNNDWFCFSAGTLYTQDKTKSGPDSIVEIKDEAIYDSVLNYYKYKI